MCKKILSFWAVLLLGFCLSAQTSDEQVLAFRRNFARADLETKYELVKAASETADENSAVFFVSALGFVDDVYEVLWDDKTLVQIAVMSIDTLSSLEYKKAFLPIRLLFIKAKNEEIQAACVRAFESFGSQDNGLIEELNKLYEDIFYKSLSGQMYFQPLLLSYISCLGVIGDEKSFSLLFNSFFNAKDVEVKNACKKALSKINVNFFSEIVQIIQNRDIYYIWAAFEIASESANISDTEMSKIAELSFSVALDSLETQETLSKKLIESILDLLTKKRWQNATDLVVSYFYKVQTSWINGNANATDLVRVIECMSVLSSKECVNALLVFLGVLNSATERGKRCNEEVVLATVKALGELGDNNAFDYLLYVDYLDYSQKIKKAARDSIARLKW